MEFAEPRLLFIYLVLTVNEEPYIELRIFLYLFEYMDEYYSLRIEVLKLVRFRLFLIIVSMQKMTIQHGISI